MGGILSLCDGVAAVNVTAQTERSTSEVATQIGSPVLDVSTQTEDNWVFRGIRQYNSKGWHLWDGERWIRTGQRI